MNPFYPNAVKRNLTLDQAIERAVSLSNSYGDPFVVYQDIEDEELLVFGGSAINKLGDRYKPLYKATVKSGPAAEVEKV